MKKRIGMAVIQLFVLCLLPLLGVTTAKAAEKGQKTMDGTTFIYEIRDAKKKTINITKIENTKEKLVIPSKINGYSVQEIQGGGANEVKVTKWEESWQNNTVKKLIIKNGVKKIDDGVFSHFNKMTSVSLPKSIQKIGERAFEQNHKLKELKIRNSKIEIATDAFLHCSKLRKVTFPKGTFSGKIGDSAFYCCDLKSLHLPYMKNMKKQIGRFAFASNPKMKKVTFSSRYKAIALGMDWFTDCNKVQITIGKQVKTFSSRVNVKAGTVRLLGSQTRLTGFKKPKNRSYYYIQFKKFIVPKNSKALPILKNACYGSVYDTRYRWDHQGKENNLFTQSEADMNEVKVVIK